MFTACIFCNSDLERNEALEAFPVGKRLAFDPARGRLWVVCRKCERWNLSPLDERWEAIEQAERRFRDSRLRVSSDNVGLARLREGLDLIRIGEPQRPEMAAWRYGDQFGRRRKRQLLTTGAIVGGVGAIYVGGMWLGVSAGAFSGFIGNGAMWDSLIHGRSNTVVARLTAADGSPFVIQRRHARMSVIVQSSTGDQLLLRLEHTAGTAFLEGAEAMKAAAHLLPTVNRFGGSKAVVRNAVTLLEEAGGPLGAVLRIQQKSGWQAGAKLAKRDRHGVRITKVPGALYALPVHERLALEMALHEESERRAMDGELAELERAWRDAEEVARIADGLFDAPDLAERLARLKDKSGNANGNA